MKSAAKTFLFALIVFSFSISASAATFAVNTTNDTADANPGNGVCADAGSNCSLRAAISEANALAGADTINIPQGNYIQSLVAANEDANAGGDWDINGDLTITSIGPGLTSFLAAFTPGTATERVLNIRSGTVVINQIAIMNGRFDGAMTANTRGAGIENLGTLTLNLCFVNSNQINSTGGNANGAGIYSAGPALTLNNTQITGNSASRSSSGNLLGGGIYSSGTGALTLTGSTVQSNSLSGHDPGGGGIYVNGNAAPGQATLAITNTSVTGNTISGESFTVGNSGGGMYALNLSNINISGSHFDGNQAGTALEDQRAQGGGAEIFAFTGPTGLQISNSTFSNNTVISPICDGGGLFLVTSGSSLSQVTATIDGSTFDSNVGTCNGMGLNAASYTGQLNLDVTNSTLSRNRATQGRGAGLSFTTPGSGPTTGTATLDLINVTISDNESQFNGGGVYLDGFDLPGLPVNFNFVTVTGNTVNVGSTGGGGVFGRVTALSARNSIIYGNHSGSGGPDIFSDINAVDFNHIGNTAGVTLTGNGPHNTFGFDPQLGPLQNNGGLTQTRLLAATSPLVNVIPNGFGDCGTTVTTDQRGFARPALSRCDIGASELQSFPGGPFSVSGRVTTQSGSPIRNILVVLSEGGLAQPRFTFTGSLGNYIFTDVPTNGYTVSISSKKYSFAEDGIFVNVFADRTDINFSGIPAASRGGILIRSNADPQGGGVFLVICPVFRYFNSRLFSEIAVDNL